MDEPKPIIRESELRAVRDALEMIERPVVAYRASQLDMANDALVNCSALARLCLGILRDPDSVEYNTVTAQEARDKLIASMGER